MTLVPVPYRPLGLVLSHQAASAKRAHTWCYVPVTAVTLDSAVPSRSRGLALAVSPRPSEIPGSQEDGLALLTAKKLFH
jgi:hypothetical protein